MLKHDRYKRATSKEEHTAYLKLTRNKEFLKLNAIFNVGKALPRCLAINDADNILYVTESLQHSVNAYNIHTKELLFNFKSPIQQSIESIWGIAYDEQRQHILVTYHATNSDNAVEVYNKRGNLISTFGSELNNPYKLIIDDITSTVLICDCFNDSIATYSANSFLYMHKSSCNFNQPKGIALVKQSFIKYFLSNNRTSGKKENENHLAHDNRNNFNDVKINESKRYLLVATHLGNSCHLLASSSNNINKFDKLLCSFKSYFRKPTDITINDNGIIFVADGYNDCIKIFEPAINAKKLQDGTTVMDMESITITCTNTAKPVVRYPCCLLIHDNQLYITNFKDKTVCRYDMV